MVADAVDLDEQTRHAAWREQLLSAGAFDDPVVRVGFLRWQVLRAGMPLRLIAQNPEAGPIPVAAAHAAEVLHALLRVIGASYQAVAVGDVETLASAGAVTVNDRQHHAWVAAGGVVAVFDGPGPAQ
jgi:hypothetical protein